jgi:hypothetical protein
LNLHVGFAAGSPATIFKTNAASRAAAAQSVEQSTESTPPIDTAGLADAVQFGFTVSRDTKNEPETYHCRDHACEHSLSSRS